MDFTSLSSFSGFLPVRVVRRGMDDEWQVGGIVIRKLKRRRDYQCSLVWGDNFDYHIRGAAACSNLYASKWKNAG